MKLEIELTENELKELVFNYLESRLGDLYFNKDDVKIEVKSKQNFKSEWEYAEFRARLSIIK